MSFPALSRILLVEDETDIQAVAQLALESIGGFTICVCGSGSQALEIGPAFAPDLILLDVMMPGMDGPATLKALRAIPQLAHTPVIFMTAKIQPHELDQFKALAVLDVIGKPFDPMTLSATILAIWEHYRSYSTGAELRSLADSYATRLPEKISQIANAWGALQLDWRSVGLAELARMVHGLHGTSATLGFARLAEVAGTLEIALSHLSAAATPGDAQRAEVAQLLGAISAIANSAVVPQPIIAKVEAGAQLPAEQLAPGITQIRRTKQNPPAQATLVDPYADLPASPERIERLIYIVGVAAESAAMLTMQLGHFGFVARCYDSASALREAMAYSVPSAIIAAASALELHHDGDNQLTAVLNNCLIPPPLLVIADHSGLGTRLSAVRAGASALFSWPVNIIALVDKLDGLTVQQALEPYRILIVDDELELVNYYAAVLRQAGMLTVVVTEPLSVMHPLIEFRPDLILMDMYMPGCDGMDLAAVIRQQEDYVSIPIVFLSAETNLDMQLEAMRLGGDDFLTKPVKPDYLISAVTSRVQRARVLQSFMLRDSLTGLFNHTTTKERLEAELARAQRYNAPLSFAIIDIDRFKSVNDTYGHPIGDRVLKSLARLLQQRLRRTDIIGRYGGEEFAVVLVGTDGPAAAMVMDQIRAGLEHIRQQAGDQEFAVTFSCGVASFSRYPDAPSLTDAADKALYSAKRSGRNRVLLADELEGY